MSDPPLKPPSFCAQAYYSAAKRFHPDKAAAAGLTPEEAEARFRDLAEAYEVLAGSLPYAFLSPSPSAMAVLLHLNTCARPARSSAPSTSSARRGV